MAKSRPEVLLSQGTVIGISITGDLPQPIEAFLGIPYAQPPVGDLRFRAPAKLARSDEIIDASKFGPAAPGEQLSSGNTLTYSEDGLTLNVFRKPTTDSQREGLLPVAIYIHGGAFNRGASSTHKTSSMLASSTESFVAVTFNYRVGALGFLPSAVSADEGVLNLGLKDQIILFEWVQENIKKFRGDPDKVTLFGLSAGAHSIGHHLMNYKKGRKALFHRVIIESGAPTSRAVRHYDSDIHEQQFQEFLKEAQVPPNLEKSQIFPFLRRLPTRTVTDAQNTIFRKYNGSLRWAFQPVIDGDIIPRPPLETWQLGLWHKMPIMTGFNRNEGSLYVDKSLQESAGFTEFFKTLIPLLSTSDIDTIDRLYPDPLRYPDSPYTDTRDGVGAQYKRIEAAYGHYAYVAPVRQTAELASASMSHPVYIYQWALISTVLNGAQHGDNKNYEVCDPKITSISASQKELARVVNAYITNFISSGDPNKTNIPARPRWEPYGESKKAMVFGAGNMELVGGKAGPAAELQDDEWGRKESEFWWSKVHLSED